MPRIGKRSGGPLPPTPQRALGAAIREIRARRGLSQEELGFDAGVHRNWVGAVERGETNPTFSSLLRLAHGLNVSLLEIANRYEAQFADQRRRQP